ncbi:hypothetical protein J6590_007266 [Homalodisca vitripennis]|nr:hypothetical protein J6590_007266 [Homalodisca vitripennis]
MINASSNTDFAVDRNTRQRIGKLINIILVYDHVAGAELVLATLPHHHDLDPDHPIHEETVLVKAFIGELAAPGRSSRGTANPSMMGKRLLAGFIVAYLITPRPFPNTCEVSPAVSLHESSSGGHFFSHRASARYSPGGVSYKTKAYHICGGCQRIASHN